MNPNHPDEQDFRATEAEDAAARFDHDIRPVNMGRLRFSGDLLGQASTAQTHVRIFRTATGYVAVVSLAHRDDGPPIWEERAYLSRDGDKLARTLFQSRGGMDHDDPDLPLLRKALDKAGIEAGREV